MLTNVSNHIGQIQNTSMVPNFSIRCDICASTKRSSYKVQIIHQCRPLDKIFTDHIEHITYIQPYWRHAYRQSVLTQQHSTHIQLSKTDVHVYVNKGQQ